jgi:Brp/Blh family beta-carotene 15,15'-monooxygenase
VSTVLQARRLPVAAAVSPWAQVVLKLGVVAVGVAVVVSVFSGATATSTTISPIAIVVALIALVVGIPHGAVDNLTLAGPISRRRRLRLTALYMAVAVVAALAIYLWPGPAFVAVLAMTVWHFGTGDVEATRELRGLPPMRGAARIGYALALGSAPVLLPLTSPAAVSTLVAIEPRLAMVMTDSVISVTRLAVLLLIIGSMLWLIHTGDLAGAIELMALAVLGYVATPLLAFAVYFGFWHALRHTARLAEVTYGRLDPMSLLKVMRGGLPALVGFVVVVAGLALLVDPSHAVGPMLWIGLVVVWGLTVPHMLFVSRFDARMRASRS